MAHIDFYSECVMQNLRSAAREVTRRYEERLRPLGLTGGQFSILAALTQKPGVSLGTLAAILAMDRTTLSRNLKPLLARGLVEQTGDSKDGRRRTLALTDEGAQTLEQALPAWRAAQQESLSRMGEFNWPELRRAIRRLG